MNAIKHFLENGWLLILILSGLGISIWRTARRIAKLSALESKIPRHDTRDLRTNAPFRRRDFAAKAEIVRKERVKGTVIAMVILLLWAPSLAAISRLAPTLSGGSLIAYQAILFVVAMGSLFAFAARGSRLARRSGLVCPGCGMELAGTIGLRRFQVLIQDRVLETGKCPGCSKQLLDPAEVGPVSQDPRPKDTALYVGMCVVLVAGIIVMVYLTKQQNNANAWTRCNRLYARAYTGSDSVVIDSTVAPRNRATCGYFRSSNTPRGG